MEQKLEKTCLYADYLYNEWPIFCQNISNNNEFCDNHQNYVNNYEKMSDMEKKFVCPFVSKKLTEVSQATCVKDKLYACNDLFYFLIHHVHFLENHKKFYDAVVQKLIELENDVKDNEQYRYVFDPPYYTKLLSQVKTK